MECLLFLTIIADKEAAIGQDTGDVEDDKTNLAGFFIEVLHGVVLCCSGGHFLSKLSLIFGLHQLFSIDFRILLAETAGDDALEPVLPGAPRTAAGLVFLPAGNLGPLRPLEVLWMVC